MYTSSYINALAEPSAQRRRTKGEPQSYILYYFLKKVTFTTKVLRLEPARLINLNQDLSFMDTRTKTKV